MKAKNIAICNQKGGVGKITTVVNLGIGLAKEGKKVLIVDTDPQADVTTCLGWRDQDNLEATLAYIMRKVIAEESVSKEQGVLHHKEGVVLLLSNFELSSMVMMFVNTLNRGLILSRYLQGRKRDYVYVLIDCMPSLGMITVNALAVDDSVIIPMQSHYLLAKGMMQLVQIIGKVKRNLNPRLKIDGIVMILVDFPTNLAKDIRNFLERQYGSLLKVYKTQITMVISVAEVPAKKEVIMIKNSAAAKAYKHLTKEVIRDGEKKRD